MQEPIAIVGLACRYPDASSPDELWESVLSQRRAFRRIPPERLRAEDYAAVDAGAVDRTYLTDAAVLEGWEFDRVGFRIAGSTFRSTDLTHWLALEVAAGALADAGWPGGDGLERARTGVLVGNTLTGEFSRAQLLRLRWPYVRRVFSEALGDEGWSAEARERFLDRTEATFKAPFPAMDEDGLAGGLSNTIAGRIANTFDLGGGGYTVDGACAASLLAIAHACSALTVGDVDVALAGGVDLSLDPFELVGFAQAGAFAREPMRVYDERSQGFWPGEGCGFVVLERLRDTIARGARPGAVIRGWGVSSDGNGSIIRPRVGGQLRALERAYRRAGFGVAEIDLFEGHGTGTSVGDLAELTALTTVRRADGALRPAAIGSIKANIGHTKAAAGVAGVIKAALSLRERVIPPTTGCDRPHDLLQGPAAALRAVSSPEAWPHRQPGRAAVSAMGFGGINAHVVLEGPAGARRLPAAARRLGRSAQDAELMAFAAADARRLRQRIDSVRTGARGLSLAELGDLAATLYRELPRSRPGARAAAVVSSPQELATALDRLSAWLSEDHDGARYDTQRAIALGFGPPALRVGLLFPGQGSPTPEDGGALERRCALPAATGPAVERRDGRAPADTSVAQPAIVAASLAGLTLLERLGLQASVAVGHSLGELTALHWAGALDADGVTALAAARGRTMSEPGPSRGAMASVAAGPDVVQSLLAGTPGVVVAGLNAPRQTTISGDATAVDAVVERARADGLAAVRLPVSHAFHSPLMTAAAERLRAVLASTPLAATHQRVVSTVTGAPLGPDADLRELLVGQLTRPVRFEQAVTHALEHADALLEVGPGHVLQGLARQSTGVPVVALDVGGASLRPALTAAGTLWALGAKLRLRPLFGDRFTRPFALDRPRRFLASPCEITPPADAPARERLEPPAANGGGDALQVLRRILAERTELPADAIVPHSHLLGDLHLTSIAVSELVARAARDLGNAPLPPTTELANATVGELAAALKAAAAGGAQDEPAVPDGAASWFRTFAGARVELEPLPATAPPCRWTVVTADDHPLEQAIREAFAGDEGEPALLVCLAPELDEAQARLLVRAGREALGADLRRCAFLQHGGGAAGFAKTLHLEHGRLQTCVVDMAPDPALLAHARARAEDARGFRELEIDAGGRCHRVVLRPLPDTRSKPALGPADIVVITGGGKGIGAECGLALGRDTGATIAIIGRSDPSGDPQLVEHLRRLAAHGVRHIYLPADVCDRGALRRAVATVRERVGDVTAVLHCAGVNVPARIADLDDRAVSAALQPKLDGLRNLLAAVDPRRLRLLVTFGSIIGRAGLRGEAHYAIANDWLAREVARLDAELPGCRCLNVEWSAWTGAGMAETLGTIAALTQQGVSPIPLDCGVQLLGELISARDVPASVVATGRFGAPPTIDLDPPELPVLRHLEQVRVHYPTVELVVDACLSRGSDPYLEDHVVDGGALVPAVFALEAMASAAFALTGVRGSLDFCDVRCQRPVTVPVDGSRTIRIAALAQRDGSVDVVLRSDETGFQTDHVSARCVPTSEPLGGTRVPPARGTIDLDPARDLYGDLLFHGPRFRRVMRYRRLAARECTAEIAVDIGARWFGDYHPRDLALGDPGARDAVIHAIQACIPHERVVPVGIGRLRVRPMGSGTATVHARERSGDGTSFVYDVVVVDAAGEVRERWDGLELRRIGSTRPPSRWPPALLATYLERRAAQLVSSGLSVALTNGDGGRLAGAADRAMAQAAGARSAIRRRADGRPEAGVGAPAVSAAHLDGYTLAVSGRGAVACDIELATQRSPGTWRELLGAERLALAELVSATADEDVDAAATRVWAAMECMKKAGCPIRAPLKLASCTPDRWAIFDASGTPIATLVTRVRALEKPVAIALLSATPDRAEVSVR